MVIEKINDFLNCYFDTLGIDDEMTRTCIRNGIINRYNKYKDYFPVISIRDDKFKNYIIKSNNGYYKLEDFLLNRLFQSLRYIFFKFDENAKSCEYNEKSRTIRIAENSIRKVALSLINHWSDSDKKDFLKILMSTVIDHELGHALKSQFDGGFKVQFDNSKILLDTLFSTLEETVGKDKAKEIFSSINFSDYVSTDDMYIKLINNFTLMSNGKYSRMIITTEELINKYSYSIGCGINKYSYSKQNTSLKNYLTLIDELLQETESMDNIHYYVIPQSKLHIGNNGNYINDFYLISGYRYILGYGKILTALLGIKDTFQATYLDPTSILEKFNKSYQSISQEVFQNDLVPFDNIGNILNKIMSNQNEIDYLQLDYFFAKCYKHMVMQKIAEESNINIESLLNEITSFQMRLTTNDDKFIRDNLPHNDIFNNLKNQLLLINKPNNKNK